VIDLLVLVWLAIFALGFPTLLFYGARKDFTYRNVTRISGLLTMFIGGVVAAVAVPFMPFGERSYVEQDRSGAWIEHSSGMRLLDTASTEALIFVMSSFLIPVLLIGLIATRLLPSYPRLSAGLLWALAFWLTVWVFPVITSVIWIVVPIALMAIATSIFGTLAFREQKEQQINELRRYRVRSS
jgi:hypothetical protein